MLDQHVQIAGERVVVIAETRLARAAEASAVVGDHAITVEEQLSLLTFPRVAIEWIAMDQEDWTAAPVVFVVDLDGAPFSLPTVTEGIASLHVRGFAGCEGQI